jgi:hypothetical protein
MPVSRSLTRAPAPLNKYSAATGVSIIVSILFIIISLFILNWLNKIAKCKCTDIPERKFLPEWWSFVIIWSIFMLFLFIAYETDIDEYPVFIKIMGTIFSIVNIVMIVRLFIYIRRLKEMNCDCGLSPEENLIYYYLIIFLSLLAFLIFVIILMFLFNVK